MLGFKLSKNGKNKSTLLKDSLCKSTEMMNEKFSEGVKVANLRMNLLKDYVDDNQDEIKKVSKTSGLTLVSLIGIGLFAFGVYSLIKE